MLEPIKPMLMQYAEPEYMCIECGVKFYTYSEEKPTKCKHCGIAFEWEKEDNDND